MTRKILALFLLLLPSISAADAIVDIAAVRGGSVNNFSWDPNDANRVYAGVGGGGLYVSSNAGISWSQVFLPNVAYHFANDVFAATTPDLVFVCEGAPSNGAIWRSADGAQTFTRVLDILADTCVSITEGTTAGTFYAGTFSGGIEGASSVGEVKESTDGGLSWTDTGLARTDFHPVAVLQLPSGRLLAGLRQATNTGFGNSGGIVYKDATGSWTNATGVSDVITSFAVSPGGAIRALGYGLGTKTVYASTDGATWTVDFTESAVDSQGRDIVWDASASSFVAMLANDKIVRSGAGPGFSFTSQPDIGAGLFTPVSLSAAHHGSIAVSPGGAILVGDLGGDGIFRSTDSGANWSISNEGLHSPPVTQATKERVTGYRYAANDRGWVWFSSGELDSFTAVYRPTSTGPESVVALAYDVADPKRIYVAATPFNDSHELKTLADATTTAEDAYPFPHTGWQVMTYPPTGSINNHVLSLVANGQTLFAGYAVANDGAAGNYLVVTSNGGASWATTSLSVVGGVRLLAFEPGNPDVIYAGSGDYAGGGGSHPLHTNGLHKSTDGGVTWNRLDSNATFASLVPLRISIDPNAPNRLWVTTRSVGDFGATVGFWESVDGGATWADIKPTHPFGFVMAYSSASDQLLVAGGGSGLTAGGVEYNVWVQTPGSGSNVWSPAFGIYGPAEVLYDGSLGIASGAGLYEATNITPITTDDDPGGDEPSEKKKDGCGCSLHPRSPMPWAALGLVAVASVVMRRRRARGM